MLLCAALLGACGSDAANAPVPTDAPSAESTSAHEPTPALTPAPTAESTPAPTPEEEALLPLDLLCTIPDGFQETAAEGVTMWTAPTYPQDGSNIALIVADATDNAAFLQQATAEVFAASTEASMMNAYGIKTTVTATRTDYELDGYSVVRIDADYAIGETAIRQISINVNADRLYNYTYTIIGDANWQEAFEAGIQSMEFLY